MSTNNFFRSDLPGIHNIVQSSMLVYPKEMIIGILRDYFSADTYYHYVKDEFGFAKVTDHTDLPLNAGLYDDATTRLFIGENYHYDGVFYPAILIKANGARYVPISASRESGAVEYSAQLYEDGYGNQKTIYTPKHFLFAGIWEGSVTIDVVTRSLRARDDLVELIGICFADIMFDTLRKAGVVAKPPNIGAPSESEDRNDKLFRQSVTMDIRTEWRRNIPVQNIIDRILISIDFQDVSNPDSVPDPNFTVNTDVSLAENLINI